MAKNDEFASIGSWGQLRRWIENCPDLVAALKEIGMPRKHKKDLTARQVRIIMEYLEGS